MESVRWLVQDIGPNDSVVLSFSGYGAQVAAKELRIRTRMNNIE